MCGTIAMLYIDKKHNYHLNWGVIVMSVTFHRRMAIRRHTCSSDKHKLVAGLA